MLETWFKILVVAPPVLLVVACAIAFIVEIRGDEEWRKPPVMLQFPKFNGSVKDFVK